MQLRKLFIFAISMALFIGCDRSKDDASSAVPASETPADQRLEVGDGSEDGEPFDEAHEHDDDHFHLGGKMYEITRRFSAIWFAGEAGNAAMVKYQTHELEEVIAEIDEAKPKEAGVDVSSRLKSDVEAHFEDLEKHAESGDDRAFEATYRKVMNNCTTCHADTKHGFIQVKLPEYNPYPNLAY